MRFACAASVMYASTLPSPCFAKPHFCVQPRKPRQRGGRRAEDLDKTRYLGLSCCPKYRVFFILQGDVFCGLRRVRGEFFRLGSFLCSYEYMKIRVRLMRTEEDENENEEHFVHVGARLASLPRGGVVFYLFCVLGELCCVPALVFMSIASLSFCGKDCCAYGVYFAFVLRRN